MILNYKKLINKIKIKILDYLEMIKNYFYLRNLIMVTLLDIKLKIFVCTIIGAEISQR